MKRSLVIPLLVLCMLSVALFAGGGEPTPEPGGSVPASAPDLLEGAQEEAEAPASTAAAAGLTVYKDPVTGRLMPIPPGELRHLLTEDVRRATSMSHEGLVETASPGGGVMVNLQGRFRSVMVATVGPEGVVTADCDQGDLDRKE